LRTTLHGPRLSQNWQLGDQSGPEGEDAGFLFRDIPELSGSWGVATRTMQHHNCWLPELILESPGACALHEEGEKHFPV
jgi:hypothetical protein